MHSDLINRIMFDYSDYSQEEIIEFSSVLSPKLLRWLGENHPDNRTRKIFYRLTNIIVGKDVVINKGFIVSDGYEKLLIIGDRVAISPNVTVICESAPNNSKLADNEYVSSKLIKSEQVTIENDVWIGAGAIILPGVVIGAGAIIGAGAVVTVSVPEFTTVAGVPAKVLGKLKSGDGY